jgi:hypothetical protein
LLRRDPRLRAQEQREQARGRQDDRLHAERRLEALDGRHRRRGPSRDGEIGPVRRDRDMTAMPSTAPICRHVVNSADAPPPSASPAPPVAALMSGTNVRPRPNAVTTSAGSRCAVYSLVTAMTNENGR